MSGYGTNKWTCGECGESFEASGVVGDLRVGRWRRDHKEEHRFEKLSPEEQHKELTTRWATDKKMWELEKKDEKV